MEIISKLPIEKDSLEHIAIDQETGLAYLAIKKENKIKVFDPNLKEIVKELDVNQPSGVSINSKSNWLLVISEIKKGKKIEQEISVFDTNSYEKISDSGFEILPSLSLTVLGVNENSNSLFCTSDGSSIGVYEYGGHTFEEKIHEEKASGFYFDPIKNHIFLTINNFSKSQILVYSGANYQLINHFNLSNLSIRDIMPPITANLEKNLLYVIKTGSYWMEEGPNERILEAIDTQECVTVNKRKLDSKESFDINQNSFEIYIRNPQKNNITKYSKLLREELEVLNLDKKGFWEARKSSYEGLMVDSKNSRIYTTDRDHLIVIQD
jgi:DNA-binding beta-propeller fold protein YncE